MQPRPAAIIVALFVAEMTVTFEGAMIYAALPTLIREFGDPLKAGMLLTAHLLIAAATAPVAGRFGDIRGRKKVIIGLLIVALIGSLLSALTTSFALILLGRALQGLSAAVLPLSIGVLRQSLPEDRVPVGVGLMTTSQGMGAALGLVLGGVIVDNLNWQWLFGASAILLAISVLLVLRWVPARPGTPTSQPIDWVEGLLPVPGIAAILFAINASKEAGWLSVQVLGLLGLGLLIMLFWGRRSLASSEPFIDLRLFTIRNFAVANGLSVLLGMGTMQIIYVFSSYMQSPAWTMVGLGLSATIAGLAKLPSNFLSFFAGPLSGVMTQRLGDRITVMIGASMAAVGWLVGAVAAGYAGRRCPDPVRDIVRHDDPAGGDSQCRGRFGARKPHQRGDRLDVGGARHRQRAGCTDDRAAARQLDDSGANGRSAVPRRARLSADHQRDGRADLRRGAVRAAVPPGAAASSGGRGRVNAA